MPENFIRLLFPLFLAAFPDWYVEVSHYSVNGRRQYNVVIFRRTPSSFNINSSWNVYDAIGMPITTTREELTRKAKELIETYAATAE